MRHERLGKVLHPYVEESVVPDTSVESIRTDLQRRIAEIRPLVDELPRLEQALAALDPADHGSSAKRASSRPSATQAPRKRRPRGANREAILAVIKSRPG